MSWVYAVRSYVVQRNDASVATGWRYYSELWFGNYVQAATPCLHNHSSEERARKCGERRVRSANKQTDDAPMGVRKIGGAR